MGFGIGESSAKNRQSTINANVGVQGQGAVGVTGSLGRNATMASVGGVAIAPIKLKGGKASSNVVNITTTTTDKDAFSTIGQMAANSSWVASEAINSSHQIAINSLLAVQNANETAARLSEMSVGGAIEVAGMAAPISEGNLELARNKKTIIIAVVAIIVIGLAVYYRKKIML